MRTLILALGVSAAIGACPALGIATEDLTRTPSAAAPSMPTTVATVPCELQIRYDDGTGDFPGGPSLGWQTATNYQFLGVRFTSPAGQAHRVQSASWLSDFWANPGLVDVTAMEAGDPSNAVTATVNVTGGGTWEVEFPNAICIPAAADYFIMLCPHAGVLGEVGEDWTAPDGRSVFNAPGFFTPPGCMPGLGWSQDIMIWSCVAPCISTPTQPATWGRLKTLYR